MNLQILNSEYILYKSIFKLNYFQKITLKYLFSEAPKNQDLFKHMSLSIFGFLPDAFKSLSGSSPAISKFFDILNIAINSQLSKSDLKVFTVKNPIKYFYLKTERQSLKASRKGLSIYFFLLLSFTFQTFFEGTNKSA